MKLFLTLLAVATALPALGREEVRLLRGPDVKLEDYQRTVLGPYQACFKQLASSVYGQITGAKVVPPTCQISGLSLACRFKDGSFALAPFRYDRPIAAAAKNRPFDAGYFTFVYQQPAGAPEGAPHTHRLKATPFPYLQGENFTARITGKLGEHVGYERRVRNLILALPDKMVPKETLTNTATGLATKGILLEVGNFVECVKKTVTQP